MYEDQFKIANLDDPNRPLALIADNPKDGNRLLWGLPNRIREFQLYEIGNILNCSLGEFLSYPRFVVEQVLSEARDRAELMRKKREEAENNVEKGKQPVTFAEMQQ